MSEKIRVYLNIGAHPAYKSLIKYPPKNVEYILPIDYNLIARGQYSIYNNIKRKCGNFLFSLLKLPRKIFCPTTASLIHTTNGIFISNKKPFVMEVEHVHNLIGSSRLELIVKEIKSNYCKKIIFWSKIAKQAAENLFKDKNITKKFTVIYPTLTSPKTQKNRFEQRLLFIGRLFYEKGGQIVIDAFQKIKNEYPDLRLTIISNTPKEIIKRMENEKRIKFINFDSKLAEKVGEIYKKHDIFVFPTHFDSFGFVILEAMAHGLPVITTNHLACPELVESGKSGIIVPTKNSSADRNGLFKKNFTFVKSDDIESKMIADALMKLLNNKNLMKKMSKYNISLFKNNNKFSINYRNKKLLKIYEESLSF